MSKALRLIFSLGQLSLLLAVMALIIQVGTATQHPSRDEIRKRLDDSFNKRPLKDIAEADNDPIHR